MARSRGIHHIAFGTKDVEATYDFYATRLGMPLAHTENHLSGRGWFRHFFFDIGNGEYLGFFAFENIGEKPGYRTDISTGLGLPPWINHVAFNVDGLEELEAIKVRCAANGVRIANEVDHGWCRSVYLVDPNGILVEFSTMTDAAAFTMSAEEALRLLRQPPEEFQERGRKEVSRDRPGAARRNGS
jgi:catechol 2,3-dioxygenase-like lactoylglutathione lyase family enzyme